MTKRFFVQEIKKKNRSVERKKNFVKMKNFWMAFCVCCKSNKLCCCCCVTFSFPALIRKSKTKFYVNSAEKLFEKISCLCCSLYLMTFSFFFLFFPFSFGDLARNKAKRRKLKSFLRRKMLPHITRNYHTPTYLSFDFQGEAYVHSMASLKSIPLLPISPPFS